MDAHLKDLADRVAASVGPDRELDLDLCLALNYMHCIGKPPLNLRRCPDDEGWLDYETTEDDGRVVECTDMAPPLSSSIDDALGLVERVLPNYRWGISQTGIKTGERTPAGYPRFADGFRAHVTARSPLRPIPFTADALTAPLAILAALLRALLAKGE